MTDRLVVPCEVYSRIVGYLRPVQNWNPGKQQEFEDRVDFVVSEEALGDDQQIRPIDQTSWPIPAYYSRASVPGPGCLVLAEAGMDAGRLAALERVPMTIFLSMLALLSGQAEAGVAFHYAKGWDDCADGRCWETIAAHHGVTNPDGYVLIAVSDCDYLGHKGLLWLRDDPMPLWVMVADCAHPDDRAAQEAKHSVAEVPYWVAERCGFVQDGHAEARLLLEGER